MLDMFLRAIGSFRSISINSWKKLVSEISLLCLQDLLYTPIRADVEKFAVAHLHE
jgi:hypothetical protein